MPASKYEKKVIDDKQRHGDHYDLSPNREKICVAARVRGDTNGLNRE